MSKSSLLPFSPMRAQISRLLKENGVRETGSDENWELQRQVARAAQLDGNSALSASEAELGIKNYAAHKEAVHLPGGPGRITFEVDNDLDVGGYNGDHWEQDTRAAARKAGVELEYEVIPGSEKRAPWYDRLMHVSDSAKVRVTATGERANVEKFFDAYHHLRMDWLNNGE